RSRTSQGPSLQLPGTCRLLQGNGPRNREGDRLGRANSRHAGIHSVRRGWNAARGPRCFLNAQGCPALKLCCLVHRAPWICAAVRRGAVTHRACLVDRTKKRRGTLEQVLFVDRDGHIRMANVKLFVEVGELAPGVLEEEPPADGEGCAKKVHGEKGEED